MQYMGGKSRIARSIAEIINEIPRWKIKNCQTHCSDNHAGCGGGIALSAYFAAVALWKAKCRAFPAKLRDIRRPSLQQHHGLHRGQV